MIEALSAPFADDGITHVLGIETRGLYFAGPIAIELNAGLVPVRKPGKIPPPMSRAKGTILNKDHVVGFSKPDPNRINTYHKAYEFEISEGIISSKSRILVVDDLLAKGGSVNACVQLINTCGASLIGAAFLTELNGLGGRENLEGLNVHSLIKL